MASQGTTKSSHIPLVLDHIRRASAENLKRAVRHYNRTLATLQQNGLEYLSASTKRKLEGHLTDGLRIVEQELRRRALERGDVEDSLEDGRSTRSETASGYRFANDSVANPV